jgi:O-antigen ligase
VGKVKRSLFLLSLLTLLASLLGFAAVWHQRGVQTFGAVDGLPNSALAPRPPLLAINVALEQYDAAGLKRALDNLSAFYWLRQTFQWDAPDWTTWDAWANAAAVRNQHFIAVLNSPLLHSSTPQSFAAFASTFAARYKDQIDVYQIGDEPNLLSGWGGQPPSASQYAALLQAAYTAIHAADPTATVLAAALAPTIEEGPDNISELTYLQQLYDLGAGRYFDGAAGKPYGFYSGPNDRQVDATILNFSRFALLRQVMERNGDGRKLLWGGNFGWNTRTDSAWGYATPEQQRDFTLAAYARAAQEWPWAGPLALENYQPEVPPTDPRWGFSIADSSNQLTLLGEAVNHQPSAVSLALPGNHLAQDPAAQYAGDWKFSDLGADVPEDYANAKIEIAFQGTDFALRVRRADYRAHLYVTIDGQPANHLPRDANGAYLILTAPELAPEVTTISVASGLAANQTHIARIQPERGWGQWAIVGFAVGRRLPDNGFSLALGFLAGVMLISLWGAWRFGRQLNWGAWGERVRAVWQRLGATGQLVFTALVGGALALTAWLTFGDDMIVVTRRFGDAAPIVLTALTAGLFYFSPSALLALLALIALFILFYLRIDLGLAFTALFIPFYLQPRLMWQWGFSLVEIATLFTLAVWLLQKAKGERRKAKSDSLLAPRLSLLDWAVLALLAVATLSLFTTDLKIVALREYRLVIVEPILFYFLLRATPLTRAQLWRIVDFFLLGAVLMAGIGLWQYATGTNLIAAEGGVMRLRSVYGSPNNVALYLGRALPIAIAVMLMSQHKLRRVAYAFAALIMGLTIGLTFSKGAWLLGVPAALAVIVIGWQGKRGAIVVGVLGILALAAWPLISRLPRFADVLNPVGGTGFFRVKLWASAWQMFLDHPLLGVGLDNFLYQYRGHYILPEAWQEPNLSHPHNIALDFLTRLGALGFACAVALLVGFGRAARAAYARVRSDPDARALTVGLIAAVADMLAHGLVDHSFFLVDLAFTFCLILALIQRFAESPNR